MKNSNRLPLALVLAAFAACSSTVTSSSAPEPDVVMAEPDAEPVQPADAPAADNGRPEVNAQDASVDTTDASGTEDVVPDVSADASVVDAALDSATADAATDAPSFTQVNIVMNLYWEGEPVYNFTPRVLIRVTPGATGVACGQIGLRGPTDASARIARMRLGGRADVSGTLRGEDFSRLATRCGLFEGTRQVGRWGMIEADGTMVIEEMAYLVPRAELRILTIRCDASRTPVPGAPNAFAVGVSTARDALVAFDESGNPRLPMFGGTLVDQVMSTLPTLAVTLNP